MPDVAAPAAALPKLEIRHVSKSYWVQGKPLLVLDDINLEIFSREFVCLVGSSGCGKSTLLNIVAGRCRPLAARCAWMGRWCPGQEPTGAWCSRATRSIPG